MASNKRDAKREAYWRNVLKRYRACGLTVRAFCQQERLTESAFYFWRRAIALRDAEAKSQTGRGGRPRQPVFLPVLVDANHHRDDTLAIELAGGRVLRLSEAISPERLAAIVCALEQTEQ
jgi:hypothetical protein